MISTPPTRSATQNFFSSEIVNDLNLLGASINWYSLVNDGTPLSGTVAFSNGTYYAIQTVNSCESKIV